jgi:glycosyltransferase involved in cell wall biosynthesis
LTKPTSTTIAGGRTFKSLEAPADTSSVGVFASSLHERRRQGRPWADRPRALRVAVFTTSYPSGDHDPSGRFVADAVERLQAQGVAVQVIHPSLAGEGGVVAKLRRRPWLAPVFLVRSVLGLRRADCELVHAHWLLSGLVAALSGKPFVLTLHGSGSAGRFSDLELAERSPRLVGAILRRARLVIAVSEPLAAAARRCGAREVRVIPNGIVLPVQTSGEVEPAEILFAGRLSPEKGIQELVEACRGLNLVVAGDGPLRDLVPDALGFLSAAELADRYRRAAIVVCPSRSEGFGIVCAEAMAHGKPVVATAVGGLQELVHHARTGFLVEPGNPAALRVALKLLLADPALRRRLGENARADVAERFAWPAITQATVEAYRSALGVEAAPEPAPLEAAA